MHKELTTPILFLIFNRPDTTKGVFEAIRKAKPPKLFVAADGPRQDKPGEWEECQKVREIATAVDWGCEVKTLFRDKNLGCKIAVSSAIDWFFENVEEGIIVEDDCLPSQSFFWFCRELLERYQDDERVMHISGSNVQNGIKRGNGSYYFSKYNLWGWATWRRAWKYYDVNIKSFPKFKEGEQIKNVFEGKRVQKYWLRIFQAVYDRKIDTWDYQWTYAIWTLNGLCILPNLNLVSNIGFGKDSTHTKDASSKFANRPVFEIHKIIHPTFIMQNKEVDQFTFNSLFQSRLMNRIIRKVKKILNLTLLLLSQLLERLSYK